ncbi:MAG: DegQ family serine endoprotease [Cardiobacteriaceae bacterium]|nr:DegQ family serine endoprotease [Cardiobacteriaceae bacterium]
MNKTLVTLVLSAVLAAAPLAHADPAPDFTALVEKTKDAVVSIEVESKVTLRRQPDIFEQFFGLPDLYGSPFQDMPREHIRENAGSGFIIDGSGYILTNAHVVDNATTVTVRLIDNREYQAEVVGVDERTDVALVKIDAKDLPVATLGDSDNVKVGDWVLAIGSPFGFSHTATKGIVSALGRSLPEGTYVPFIQTDAAVNPGNSGGPLFNSQGEVIGINSQIYSRSGAFNGLAFAIPMNLAKNIADQLKDGGKIQRGFLGIGLQHVDQKLAKSFGMDTPRGALVTQVLKGSPAEKAGVKAGDVVLSFNGKPINKAQDLPPLVALSAIDKDAEIAILRDGKEMTLKVRIGNLDDADSIASTGSDKGSAWGMELKGLASEERSALNFHEEGGVLIAKIAPKSAAEESGLRAGDIILAIAGQAVSDAGEVTDILRRAPKNRPVPVLVYRNGNTVFLALVPPQK